MRENAACHHTLVPGVAVRITYLLTTADAGAGTERAILTQAGGMAARGHRVEVLSLFRDADEPHHPTPPGVVRHSLIDRRATPGDDASGPSRIIASPWDDQITARADALLPPALRSSTADVLVASTPALTAFAVQFAPAGTVIVEQEHRATGRRGPSLVPLDVFGPRVDCLVSLTRESQEWLLEHFGSRAPRLEVIPNAISPVFRPQASCREKLIVGAGRLVPAKQFDHLILAFALLSDEFSDWSLRIYGDGPDRRRLERLVRAHRLSDRIELVPSVPTMVNEWAKASIAALTSSGEGLPLVGLESIAAGVPFVSYDCPTGPSDIIIEGHNGLLVPNGDIRAFSDALSLLISDEQIRVQMGRNARASCDRFDETVVNDAWEALYLDLRATHGRAVASPVSETGAPAPAEPVPADDTWVPIGDLLPQAQMQRNRDLVLQNLASVPLLVAELPVEGAYAAPIAIAEPHRASALLALSTLNVPGLRIELERGGGVVAAQDLPVVARRAKKILISQELNHPGVRLPDYPELKCEIQFWAESPGRPGSLVAPFKNPVVDRLAVSSRGDSAEPGKSALHLSLWTVPDFPVDLVYTWVDGSDPAWLSRKQDRSGQPDGISELAVGALRFKDRQELRYSLRSVCAFLPWIRNIFIVTDQQVPSWLSLSDDRVRIVDHREIFPDLSALPTFNSQAIETCLHHIEGLSEHFLYLNDDILLHRPLAKSAFFEGNGNPKFFPSPIKLNYLPDPEPHIASGINNRRLLAQMFGKEISNLMLHAPHAHRRSTLDEIERTFPEAVAQTRAAPFRSDTDISMLSSFAQYYGFFTGRASRGSLSTQYCTVDAAGIQAAERLVRNPRTCVVGFGEPNTPNADEEGIGVALRTVMADLVPFPSPYELPGEAGSHGIQTRLNEAFSNSEGSGK